MARNEKTSERVARIAAKVLAGVTLTLAEIRSLAASALTQTQDKKSKGKKARKRKTTKAKRS